MNMLYDCCFLAILLLSLIGSIKMWRNPAINTLPKKIVRGLCLFTTSIFILWQLALWTIPVGNRIAEGIRLPRHFWCLENEHLYPTPTAEKIKYGDHEKHYLMYYPAPDNSTTNTVVFYWHGGGWHTGSPHQHRHLAALLHQQGYTVIMPAYRLGPVYGYPEIKADVDSAFVFGCRLLKQKGFSNPNLILGGSSAGSNVAALLTFDEKRWETLGLNRDKLLGYFGIVSVLDLDKMGSSHVLENYAGKANSEQYNNANPIAYISPADTIPTLCLHGTKDGLAPIENTISFCKQLEQNTSPAFISLHSFENKTHLEVGSFWYYDATYNYGQDSILTNWMDKIRRQYR